MKVVSTNKGKSVEINYHGKIVKTGIYKYPVKEGIFLGKEDVKDDSVIDRRYHGGIDKACYWYSEKHYEFWQKRFPDLDWKFGMFGENLSISELDEGEIKIGDIYEIGECLVQVSQPRQPCYKLNYRFDCDTMVKEFIQAGFPGVYIRVLQEGMIREGDELILKERKPGSLSVREVYQLLYQLDKDPELLKKALDDVALAESCRRDLSK
ncbi:MOSC domain-containing protein [Marinifilum caeruleilacunae]|uniref:MOSC domain-containing protein n=1 Tax=Marinifilum caeruleilacunae TaxID=2499076 RepID=A0ABX1WRB7_9BACT|nr:MOSC domain-containing protein [Marinifilum caeruleilacunae]NOU58608.1 MOSC domain-containing protein [Marinifilum caeruleilacunae]